MTINAFMAAMLDVDTTGAVVVCAVVMAATYTLMVAFDSFVSGLLLVPPLTAGALAGNGELHFYDIARWTGFGHYEQYANLALAAVAGVLVVFLVLAGLITVMRAFKGLHIARSLYISRALHIDRAPPKRAFRRCKKRAKLSVSQLRDGAR